MFLSSKRNLARENEELKAEIAALTQGKTPPRQGWGLGLEQSKSEFDRDRLEIEIKRLADEKYRFEARATRGYASQVVQALLLLNGVGALAVLLFIGIFSKDTTLRSLLLGLSNPLSCFADGAALAVLTAIFAYLGQASSADGSTLWANTHRLLAIVLALGSLLLFAAGISQLSAVLSALP